MPAPVTTASRPVVEIDGRELSGDVAAALEEVVVDDHLQLPDTFEIRISDPEGTALAGSGARIGSLVTVSATSLTDPAPVKLVSGEVTALEAEYSMHGSRLIIRGYDHSHRLMRGRRTETYHSVTDGDIAGQVADRAGLQRGTIDDPGDVFDQVSQTNQSDWDFLRERARAADRELVVEDGKLHFRTPSQASSAPGEGGYDAANPLQLTFGDSLLDFRPRVTSAGQVSQVEVRGWSVSDKKAVVGHADAGTTAVAVRDDPSSLAALFGSPTFVSVDSGPDDEPAADAFAGRLAELIGSAFVEATGIAVGQPHLRAGAAVSISHVGDAFAGRYTLTRTRHTYDLVHGYRTAFTISGRQERSLLGLASGARSGVDRVPGVAIGIVDDVADPLNMGRVRVRLPWLSDDYVGPWARVAMPGAGPDRGMVWLPEHDDEVLVAFEQGDVSRPVVLGGLWNGKDPAPAYKPNAGAQDVRLLVSRLGHTIEIADGDDRKVIELRSADGNLSITLDQSNGEIAIKAGATTKLTLSAGGDLTISAQGKLSLSGQAGAELSSSASTTVKGATLALNPPG